MVGPAAYDYAAAVSAVSSFVERVSAVEWPHSDLQNIYIYKERESDKALRARGSSRPARMWSAENRPSPAGRVVI
jgi:hypothetical protein